MLRLAKLFDLLVDIACQKSNHLVGLHIQVSGQQGRAQKADALSQIQTGLDQITASVTDISKQEADAYAALNAQVKILSDQIKADAKREIQQALASRKK